MWIIAPIILSILAIIGLCTWIIVKKDKSPASDENNSKEKIDNIANDAEEAIEPVIKLPINKGSELLRVISKLLKSLLTLWFAMIIFGLIILIVWLVTKDDPYSASTFLIVVILLGIIDLILFIVALFINIKLLSYLSLMTLKHYESEHGTDNLTYTYKWNYVKWSWIIFSCSGLNLILTIIILSTANKELHDELKIQEVLDVKE
ncbi:hypothetical protein ACM0LK_03100 [Mycoplasma sp. Z331B]|uniref:hypothetical protein n=1 Tax=unclassified Mycoplasma TaxID=2683645 RepID=UPI003A88DB03